MGFCDVVFGWDINDLAYQKIEFTGWHTGYPDAIAKILAKQYAFRVNGVVEDKLAPASATNGYTKVSVVNADAPLEQKQTEEGEKVSELKQLALAENILTETAETHLFDICPECGAGAFAYEEGCRKCYACGHSEC